jgi:hypothetical protein
VGSQQDDAMQQACHVKAREPSYVLPMVGHQLLSGSRHTQGRLQRSSWRESHRLAHVSKCV